LIDVLWPAQLFVDNISATFILLSSLLGLSVTDFVTESLVFFVVSESADNFAVVWVAWRHSGLGAVLTIMRSLIRLASAPLSRWP